MKKKLLSLALALLLMLSLLPAAAFAAGSVPEALRGTYTGNTADGSAYTIEIGEAACSVTFGTYGPYVIPLNNAYSNGIYEFKDVSGSGNLCSFNSNTMTCGHDIFIGSPIFAPFTENVTVTPPHTHTLTLVSVKDATCEAAGVKTAYYVCSGDNGCGKAFTDNTAATEISGETLAADYLIAKLNHSYTGDYVQNEEHTKHAQLCVNGCNQPGEYTDCTGGTATCMAAAECEVCGMSHGDKDASNHVTEGRIPVEAQQATCEQVGWDAYTKCACGAKLGYNEISKLEHSYTGDYVQNEANTQHARLCVNGCGQPGTFSDCTGGTATCEAKAICDVCKAAYGDVDNTAHSFATEWTTDADNHWHAATCTHGDEKDGVAPHVDEDVKDHKCDVCGYVMSECKDETGSDHKCDVCGKVLTECVDGGDGFCEVCGKEMEQSVPVKPVTPAFNPFASLVKAANKIVTGIAKAVTAIVVAEKVEPIVKIGAVIAGIGRLFR